MMTKVFCTLSFEGTHYYPDAPDEVHYLREPHRHVFGMRVEMEVFDDDREVEFIMLKHRIQSHLYDTYPCDHSTHIHDLNTRSCEHVARALASWLQACYGSRAITVAVDEDGENGAIVCEGDA